MGTTAASVLDERLCKLIGQWLEVAVTTALTTSTAVTSTNFNAYDDAEDDHFNNQWVYITDYVNLGENRKIYDYTTSGGVSAVRGGNFTDDGANTATVRISRHGYNAHLRALNDAIRELYPILFRHLEDRTLVTGNILPDNSFELWTSSSNPSLYSASNATLARTTTAGYIRGALGTTSMKVTDSGSGGGYAYISSDTFPRLLDLMGKTVTLKCPAYPEDTADDASIEIYTKQADGTAQSTLISATSNPKGEFTLLELEDQTLNDDLVEVTIKFKVATASASVYFDSARLTGIDLREYLLLSDFADGDIAQVYVQTTGSSDDICDDLHPRDWDRVFNYSTYSDGTYLWLRLPYYSSNRQIRILGTAPLSELLEVKATSFASTTEIDGNQVDLLTAYAAYCLFRNEEGVPSSEDVSGYRSKAQKWLMEYYRLKPSLRMVSPRGTMHLPTI